MSAVQKGKVAAVQFHPEKSGTVGLNLIRDFLTDSPAPSSLPKVIPAGLFVPRFFLSHRVLTHHAYCCSNHFLFSCLETKKLCAGHAVLLLVWMCAQMTMAILWSPKATLTTCEKRLPSPIRRRAEVDFIHLAFIFLCTMCNQTHTNKQRPNSAKPRKTCRVGFRLFSGKGSVQVLTLFLFSPTKIGSQSGIMRKAPMKSPFLTLHRFEASPWKTHLCSRF